MTKLELLEDTVAHYSADPEKLRCKVKSINTGKSICQYSATSESKGCAIGRFLDKGFAAQLDVANHGVGIGIYGALSKPEFRTGFPEWMLQLESGFLTDIQELHDSDKFWTQTGLSELGEHRVKYLKSIYQLAPPEDCENRYMELKMKNDQTKFGEP